MLYEPLGLGIFSEERDYAVYSYFRIGNRNSTFLMRALCICSAHEIVILALESCSMGVEMSSSMFIDMIAWFR